MEEDIKLISKPKDHGKHKVYGIFDPDEAVPRYIGTTELALLSRLGRHMGERHTRGSKLFNYWLNYVEHNNRVPEIKLIKTFKHSWQAYEYENYLITKYWDYICNMVGLTNKQNIAENIKCVEETIIDRKKEAKPFGFTVNKKLRKLPFTNHPHLKHYWGEN